MDGRPGRTELVITGLSRLKRRRKNTNKYTVISGFVGWRIGNGVVIP
jgi:hypothetical protein